MITKAFPPLLACFLAAGVLSWWGGYKIGSGPVTMRGDKSERWVRVGATPGFQYHLYRVELQDGTVAHVEGTHYVLERGGTGLAIKDAATQNIIFYVADKDLKSVERE